MMNAARPRITTIVTGFGRCGSSLVMQMLAAGGMPTMGRFPAFECEETGDRFLRGGLIPTDFMEAAAGRAVKILDPHRGVIPHGNYRVIWCRRDPQEQARSTIKFLRAVSGLRINRRAAHALEKSYSHDLPAALASLQRAGATATMTLDFESILERPDQAAAALRAFCGPLHVPEMARAVIARSPMCAPDMAIEERLIALDRARQASPSSHRPTITAAASPVQLAPPPPPAPAQRHAQS